MRLSEMSSYQSIVLALCVGCVSPPPTDHTPVQDDTFAPSSDIGPGTDTFLVPVGQSDADTVAVRLHWPASDRTRFEALAPVVIQVEGGWHAGELSEIEAWTLAEVHGYIHLSFLLPGGRAIDGSIESTGELDTRGEASVAAFSAVLDYAAGLIVDTEGKSLADRVPFADLSHIGLLGESNGANLILAALSTQQSAAQSIRWASFWESPVGDQFATTEINENSFYVPGSCIDNSCPLDGMETQLRFDADGKTQVIFDGSPAHLDGVFFLDADLDNHPDPDERRFSGIPQGTPPSLKVYPSVELRQTLVDHQATVFNESEEPTWLPSTEEVADFWASRDGSNHVSSVQQLNPQLLVIVTQRKTDHVLTTEDHPHALSHLQLWKDSGAAFFRLNPDSVYMSQVTGIESAFLPDNPANAIPTFPASMSWMVPNEVDGLSMTTAIIVGSLLELADRAHYERLEPDLSSVITSSR